MADTYHNFYEELWELTVANPTFHGSGFGKAHASSLARQVVSRITNAKGSRLVDIGCDSAMLCRHVSILGHSASMGTDISSYDKGNCCPHSGLRFNKFIAFILDRLLFWENKLRWRQSWGMSRCYIACRLSRID